MDRDAAYSLLAETRRADQLAGTDLAAQLAVLGTFDPAQIGVDDDAAEVVELLCTPLLPRDDHAEAAIADPRRVEALARVLADGGRAALARLRDRVTPGADTPLQRMLDAFVRDRSVPVDERSEDELVASLDVWRWATEAVARAGLGGAVEVEPSREEIESRLALLDVTRPVRKLVEGRCVGRERELAELHAYRHARPEQSGLIDEPALVVFGIGGVGKSTLVARFVMDLYEQSRPGSPQAWAYLDLDRPTLRSYTPDAVLEDVIRQAAAHFPDQRRLLTRIEEIRRELRLGAGLDAVDAVSYRALGREFAQVIQRVGDGSLVVVLDTFEEVERTSPERANELYDLFAALSAELPALRLIVSGRAPAAAFSHHDRADRRLHLTPLGGGPALELLRLFAADEAARSSRPAVAIDDDLGNRIVRVVGGIPLTLRLAAHVLAHEGGGAVLDAAARAGALDRVRTEFVRGFLYQRVLDHIKLPDRERGAELRSLAKASLVLRWVSPELIDRVLVPALGFVPAATPQELFAALAAEVAMAERDGARLMLREELRGPALAALRIENDALVRRVHQLAAAHFAATPGDADAQLEAAYHRLAAGEPADAVGADVGDEVLRRLEPSLADLPPAAASELGRTLDDRQAIGHARDLASWEQRVLPEADAALRARDLDRVHELLDVRSERTAGTALHRLESRLLEAEGDLDAAVAAAGRDMRGAEATGDPVRFGAAVIRLASLHEQLGRADAADAVLRDALDEPVVAGHPEIRLELLLTGITTRERAGLETEDSRWSMELAARVLMQRSAASLDTNTGLLRLLAAALGRDEPERIRAAVRRIGLGRAQDVRRVADLVGAVAAWDREQPEPGQLARGCNLRLDPRYPDHIERAWRGGLSGTGTGAAALLERLWGQAAPPEPVREAIRAVYLWWVAEPAATAPPAAAPRPSSFLDEVPLDWTRTEALALEELILTAYPTSTDARLLADRAGLPLDAISWSGSNRRITRELLGTAASTGLLRTVVDVVLTDKEAVSIHPELLRLVAGT